MAKKQASNHVFLSYSRDDHEEADKLKARIEKAAKWAVWMDCSGIHAGDLWRRQIVEAIEDCRLFIPILSTLLYLEPNDISKEVEYQLIGLHQITYDDMLTKDVRPLRPSEGAQN